MGFKCSECSAELPTAADVLKHEGECGALARRRNATKARAACPVCGEMNPHAGKDGEYRWASDHRCSLGRGMISPRMEVVRDLLQEVIDAVAREGDVVTPEWALLAHVRKLL